jgi:hypothetical protein
MPSSDITKCTNDKCELNEFCWRFKSPSNGYYQSYCCFTPTLDVEVLTCEMFIAYNFEGLESQQINK